MLLSQTTAVIAAIALVIGGPIIGYLHGVIYAINVRRSSRTIGDAERRVFALRTGDGLLGGLTLGMIFAGYAASYSVYTFVGIAPMMYLWHLWCSGKILEEAVRQMEKDE